MRNSWIHVHEGQTARQARVGVADLNEEHYSRGGFFGPVSMLYHGRKPADPVRVEGPISIAVAPLGALTFDDENNPSGLPTEMLTNDELSIALSHRAVATPHLVRNVDADTLYFIHEGEGVVATEFGPIEYEPEDLILIPKGTTYRHMPSTPTTAEVVESVAPIEFTEHQQIGRHSPIDFGVLGIPKITEYDWPEQEEWEVKLKHGPEITCVFYAELPFDLIGWKGDLFPFKLNLRDIRPLTSERIHLAPSSWAILESASFMCVPFLPMSVVSDPEAEELPTRHRNVDADEVILIRRVNGKTVNALGHFPQGMTHGPAAAERDAYAAVYEPGMQRMLEGLSIDSYRRLHRTPTFEAALPSAKTREERA